MFPLKNCFFKRFHVTKNEDDIIRGLRNKLALVPVANKKCAPGPRVSQNLAPFPKIQLGNKNLKRNSRCTKLPYQAFFQIGSLTTAY
jgi:hypothetical protein